MVFFNYALRKLNAKIVYYGPGLCGKTTNLQWIHDHFEGGEKGKMVSLATEGDRTIFFDLLPLEIGRIRGMDVTLQLYTVPGQVHYNSTRQLVLRGADGVVFVADSQKTMRSSNVDSLRNLEENLSLQGINLAEFPHVLQFNKRDLGDLLSNEEMDASLNSNAVPIFEAVAIEGIGVQETLEGIVKLVMRSLKERYESRTPEMRPIPKATVTGTTGPWPTNLPTTVGSGNASAIPETSLPSSDGDIAGLSPFDSDHTVPPPAELSEPVEEESPAPEDVDTHTDILFPDEDVIDELDELEPELFEEEIEEEIEKTEEAPVEFEETVHFPPPVTAPPPEDSGAPSEPRDEASWTMPFETVDIATLPGEDVDASEPEPEPDAGHFLDVEKEEGDSLPVDDGSGDQFDDEEQQAEVESSPAGDEIHSGVGDLPADDETQSDRFRPAAAQTEGVEDLVASILDGPDHSLETESAEAVDSGSNEIEAFEEAAPEPDEELTADENQGAMEERSVEDELQEEAPDAAEVGPFDSEPTADQPEEAEVADAAFTAASVPAPRTPPVPVVLDDGDPFGGEGWDHLPAPPTEPPVELLPATDVGDAEVSTPVDVAVEDNSLALKLTGTGAIVESGQVRAIDIEVPVPGSWVGHNRVTMQLRLTLVPAPEDEDA